METGRIWEIDPLTLREVLLDPNVVLMQLPSCSPKDRVWALRLLGRYEEAAVEAEELLRDADNRFAPLLLLAHVYQCQHRWQEAAVLQEEALQLSRTRYREATVRRHIGRRLFEETKFADAAKEFQWAQDLWRAVGASPELIASARMAMDRAHQLTCSSSSTIPHFHPSERLDETFRD